MGDYDACKVEFRCAVEDFPTEPRVWLLLNRMLELKKKAGGLRRLLLL